MRIAALTNNDNPIGILEGLVNELSMEDSASTGSMKIGFGLGASKRTAELVEKGLQLELLEALQKIENPVKGAGAPAKGVRRTNDSIRALLLYSTAERLRAALDRPPSTKIEMPIKRMIALTEELFPTRGIFKKIKNDNKLYASVKKGRLNLGIDEYWRGDPWGETPD